MTSNLIITANMELKVYLKEVEKFLKDYLEKTHMNQYVLGLSGGVDSSLVAAIAKNTVGKDKLTCIMMPIDSHPSDLIDAKKVAQELDLNYIVIDGSKQFHESLEEFARNGIELDRSTQANLKVRIRMTILYAYAQKVGGLVLGTDNKDERYTGYFTKYGDGACDILPIVHLLKREVMEGCKIYGLSTSLAERTPTAGLYEGQTDEKEMGVTYDELDNYLMGHKIKESSKERIERLHRISEHKRIDIPTPKEYKRD